MAQLSTDTLAYTQIISDVQNFIINYVANNSVNPKVFNDEYQKLLSKIKQTIGGPTAVLELINKGDIPSSTKINQFYIDISNDINILANQLDSLSANYVSSYNMIFDEIESEKESLERIRGKVAALEIYSGSSAHNVTYYGDMLNNLDYIDVNKIKQVPLCDVANGVATLPVKQLTKVAVTARIYNENYNNLDKSKMTDPFGFSSGLPGCSFLYSNEKIGEIVNPFLFEKDPNNLKQDVSKSVDSSPISYFEYECVNVLDRISEQRAGHEYEYKDQAKKITWGEYDTKNPLVLTIELSTSSGKPELINHVSIVPFFGYDNDFLNAKYKNIKVKSIKIYNSVTKSTLVEVLNSGPVYIGADISTFSIKNYNNFSYQKGIFRFAETLADKIYIVFEQENFNNVTIKHAYWTPYLSDDYKKSQQKSPKWNAQNRFNPQAAGVLPEGSYNIHWNDDEIIPKVQDPNSIKSSSKQDVNIQLKYNIDTTQKGQSLKLINSAEGEVVYFSKIEEYKDYDYLVFTKNITANQIGTNTIKLIHNAMVLNPEERPCVLLSDGQTLSDLEIDIHTISVSTVTMGSDTIKKITVVCTEQHQLNNQDYISIRGTVVHEGKNYSISSNYTVSEILDPYSFNFFETSNDIIDWPLCSGVSGDNLVLLKCFAEPGAQDDGSSNVEISIEDSKTPTQNIVNLWLKRNFEYVKANRAAIGIRDIFVGRELFSQTAEIISKPYMIDGNLDLLSLEVFEIVPKQDEFSGAIDYYISVDSGIKWIKISPIHRPYTGSPEIISFNQNISNDSQIPQIAYYNYPEVPNPIRSVTFRAVFNKPKNKNETPILDYYRLGARFR